jgi:hypothetical protein
MKNSSNHFPLENLGSWNMQTRELMKNSSNHFPLENLETDRPENWQRIVPTTSLLRTLGQTDQRTDEEKFQVLPS